MTACLLIYFYITNLYHKQIILRKIILFVSHFDTYYNFNIDHTFKLDII